MRKVILSMNITEDGFMAGPNGELDWHFPYWDFEMCEALSKLLSSADTILLGRKTYSAMAGYWTTKAIDFALSGEDIVLSEIMNRYTKVVVSKTLSCFNWINSRPLGGELIKGIVELKQKPGKDIVVLGSSTLVAYLIKHDLIDQYHLWVHPVILRKGTAFPNLQDIKINLKPAEVEVLTSGVSRFSYR
ncbi:dihydrofolate reductase family protein [Desertivirga xinjiangensis]|uniref:dihydrofolate reductase family protein n=1 Tax=Desertivirga xinjiangensis TaxID=539206 RepID=UPI002108E36B|nr:dihydrofolate reductase family protein [Pedobacter xinjiangensis]